MSTSSDSGAEPLTVKDAVALLASLPASMVLPLFRQPDFMMVAGLAFAGFRVDAGGYGNPVVRKRLAEEAVKNVKFAEQLRLLAAKPKPAVTAASPAKEAKAAAPASAAGEAARDFQRDSEKYRAERDRLKLERDTAVAARRQAEREYAESRRETLAAQTARAEAERELERLRQRLERSERKQRQLETTNAMLRKAAVHVTQSPTPAAPASPIVSATAPSAEINAFAAAVSHLLGKQREGVALSLADDVLRDSHDDVDALEIKSEALERMGKVREAAPTRRTAVTVLIKRGQMARAARNFARLLIHAKPPTSEQKAIREFLTALSRSIESAADVREALQPLKIDHPEGFAYLKSSASRDIANRVFYEDSVIAPEAALPLAFSSAAGMTLTPRRIVNAIDQNDVAIVDVVRQALAAADEPLRNRILMSVTLAADGDEIYSAVLAPRTTRGPIIVDASNVAWHGQEMVAQQQPRLEYVLSIRRALRERGYFPVILLADANLPFVVNDTQTARRLVEDDQITLSPGGSDADELILRDAQRLRAPVVTNDYMADWDPQQNVLKIQYSLSIPDGKPTLYF